MLSSKEVNRLVLQYLRESGFKHAAFAFQSESGIKEAELDVLSHGGLVAALQKAVSFMSMEYHVLEDGTEVECGTPFRLTGKHMCSKAVGHHREFNVLEKDRRKVHRHDRSYGQELDKKSHLYRGDEEESEVLPKRGVGRPPKLVGGVSGRKSKGRGAKENLELEHRRERINAEGDGDVVMQQVPVPPVEALQVNQRLVGHASDIFSVSWNPKDPSVCATSSGDGTVRVWNLSGDVAHATVLVHDADVSEEKQITSMEWSNSGDFMATGTFGGVLRVWSKSGELKMTRQVHQGPILAVRWSHNGQSIAVGSADSTFAVIVSDQDGVREVYRHILSSSILDLKWRGSDAMVALACADGTIAYVRTDKEDDITENTSAHQSSVNVLRWNQDATQLASASDDGTVKIWATDLSLQRTLDIGNEVYSIQWRPTPDSSQLASSSYDCIIRIWNVVDGSCMMKLEYHTDVSHALAFHPDGNRLLSGALDGRVILWNIHQDGPVAVCDAVGENVLDVAWSVDGRRAVVAAEKEAVVFEL